MHDRRSVLPAVVLLAGAGVVHLAATPVHLEESMPLGVGFVALGVAQLGAAAWLLARPARPTRLVAAGLQLVAIGAWALSRTVGLPLVGDGAEPLGAAGMVTVLLEGLSVLALLARPRPQGLRGATAVLVATSVIVLTGAATAVAALGEGHHRGADDAHAHDGDGHRDEGHAVSTASP